MLCVDWFSPELSKDKSTSPRIPLVVGSFVETTVLWKLQAGLGATTAATAADSTQFQRLQSALSGDLFEKASLASKAGDLQSTQNATLQDTSTKTGFYAGVKSEFTQQEAALGVDTDQEMQRLLQIENYYAANAKVIETLDDMMATLMRI